MVLALMQDHPNGIIHRV